MDVVVRRSATGWRVVGEIDAATCSHLEAAFRSLPDTSNGPVEVDLEGVSFMDSSGLRILIDFSNRLRAQGGGMVVCNPSHTVRRLLEITQLGDQFGLDRAQDDPTP